MKAFGEFLANMKPIRVALSFIAMALGATFLAGVSTANLLEKPAQVTANKEALAVHDSVNMAQDTSIANVVRRQDREHGEITENFERVFCFLRLVIADERPIPAMACEPGEDQ